MQKPGWYSDPSENPKGLRYWDGSAWTDITARKLPRRPETAVGPGRWLTDGPVRWITVISLAVALLMGWWWWLTADGTGQSAPPPRSSSPSQPGGQPSTQTTPDQTPSHDPSATNADKVDRSHCQAGNAQELSTTRLPRPTHAGLTLDYPKDWDTKIHRNVIPWLDDVYAWASASSPETGAVFATNPSEFPTDLRAAARQNWVCWAVFGPGLRHQFPEDPGSPGTRITTNGVDGWELRVHSTTASGGNVTTIIRTYRAEAKVVTVIGYTNAHQGSTQEAAVEKALETLRKA